MTTFSCPSCSKTMESGFVAGRAVQWQPDNQVRFSGERIISVWGGTRPAHRCTTCGLVLLKTTGAA